MISQSGGIGKVPSNMSPINQGCPQPGGGRSMPSNINNTNNRADIEDRLHSLKMMLKNDPVYLKLVNIHGLNPDQINLRITLNGSNGGGGIGGSNGGHHLHHHHHKNNNHMVHSGRGNNHMSMGRRGGGVIGMNNDNHMNNGMRSSTNHNKRRSGSSNSDEARDRKDIDYQGWSYSRSNNSSREDRGSQRSATIWLFSA